MTEFQWESAGKHGAFPNSAERNQRNADHWEKKAWICKD